MKNKFPYPGITKKVTEEMCDLNGHMNVTFYTKIFEEGSYETVSYTHLRAHETQ